MRNSGNYCFSSESVSEGHPDKLCDQISDAILDAALFEDKFSRVACESFITTDLVLVGGEITTKANLDIDKIARDVLREVGYTDAKSGIDWKTCTVLNTVHEQSKDIALGVDNNKTPSGAGDQGLMFGYACTDTPQLMPAPINFAHSIMLEATSARKEKKLPFLGPDSKCQVSVRYKNGRPDSIETVVLSHQHTEEISNKELHKTLIEEVIKKALPSNMLSKNITYLINPTGRFVIGGPHGDTGLTGRKIIVDTYGGKARHGGGAFSGKDPSKVDRSATYMARCIAKNIVASGICDECEIQLAYAIGTPDPVSLYVSTFGTGKVSEYKIENAIREIYDLTPSGIISFLDLTKPIYKKTSNYGHFGRKEFSWEATNEKNLFSKL